MTPDEYIKNAIKTESPYKQELLDRMCESARPLHAAMGLCTEVGEIQDALKKHIFYDNKLDIVNLHEESGDLMWYMAVLIHWMNSQLDDKDISFTTVLNTNISKLKARYGDKFTEDAATVRNLDEERKILEI